jgi:uncharacterized protein (TIGR02646 family)
MRAITKGAEPPSLTAHRQTPHCDYDNYADKDALRHALVTEQRGVCCYCMGRIQDGPGRMKIEHWRCQRDHPRQQLNYRNLLGACLGGQGQPAHFQHCDTRKGDRDLLWNPADPAHRIETRIRYELDGSIRATEPVFDAQLDDVLNLNIRLLKNNRKAVWVAVTEWWTLEKAWLRGRVPRSQIQKQRDRRVGGDNALEPYSQVAVWWLDQRLARMSA